METHEAFDERTELAPMTGDFYAFVNDGIVQAILYWYWCDAKNRLVLEANTIGGNEEIFTQLAIPKAGNELWRWFMKQRLNGTLVNFYSEVASNCPGIYHIREPAETGGHSYFLYNGETSQGDDQPRLAANQVYASAIINFEEEMYGDPPLTEYDDAIELLRSPEQVNITDARGIEQCRVDDPAVAGRLGSLDHSLVVMDVYAILARAANYA